ncbi:MAG: diguanylate cyclase [Pseudomonadota bacterium]
MPPLPDDTRHFVSELDDAVQAHMDWTRRIIRCAVLRTPPDADVVDPHAHTLCRFGGWFAANRAHFDALDPAAAGQVEAVHQRMHDAMRVIFSALSRCEAGSTGALEAFEATQAELITLLAQFKTQVLSSTVRHDPLTGLPLRHGIENDFARHRKEAGRSGDLLYVVMIDIDHFKRVNDTYGHPAGDEVLRRLCDTLKQTLRGNEPLYRYGGEEFLWLLKCRSVEEAKKSARRALATVGTTPIPIPGDEILRLTITLGLARACEEEDLASVLERADQALYQGKRNGRNCYVFAEA